MKSKNSVILFILLLTLVTPLSAGIYMQVQGIAGSSQAASHRNWCSVEAFTLWPRAALSSAFQTGASEFAQHQMSNVVVIKKDFDRASPALSHRAATGTNIANITIHFTARLGGVEKTVISYQFSNCHITGMSVSAVKNSRLPQDEVEFRFQRAKVIYTTLNEKGQIGKPVAAAWEGARRERGTQEGHPGGQGKNRGKEPGKHFEEPGQQGELGEHHEEPSGHQEYEEHPEERGEHRVIHGEIHRRELLERRGNRFGR